MDTKYITVEELLGELKDHPMLEDLTLERVITYAIQFCKKWGANVLFEEKIVTLKAEDFRVLLPCDFYKIISIRDHYTKLNYRYSTDVFHYMPDHHIMHDDINVIDRSDFDVDHEVLTYKVNGNVVFLSTKSNTVDIVYQSIASDENGYPLILDDETYLQALRDYIKVQRFTILFDTGKIQGPVLQNAQQQYGFSAKVLRNHMAKITPDQAESMANILNNMIIHRGQYNGYKHIGENNPHKNF
jgi:hypothetical protein